MTGIGGGVGGRGVPRIPEIVHYSTTLLDGTQFDWSCNKGTPFKKFVLNSYQSYFISMPFNEVKVAVIPNCSILAAVGQKMASTPGVSAALFNALAKANINVRAIAQGYSEYNITVVVNRKDCVRALRAVHSRFYLSKTSIAVGIIGPGLIGATLLNQLRDQWETYAIKGSGNLTIKSQGDRCTSPANSNFREVSKRLEMAQWHWRV